MLNRAAFGFVCVLASAICALALAAPTSAAPVHALAWGENEVGQLGDGTTSSTEAPVAVSGLGEVTALAGGRRHSLALLGDGGVDAWGENGWGQLGDGTDTGPESCHAAYAEAAAFTVACSREPVPVSGLSGVVAIAAGAQDSLALLSDGKVMAWGDNESGQLGDGSMSGPDHCYKEEEPTQCSTSPTPVKGLGEVTAIAAGENFGLALLKNSTVMAWGSDQWGELGDGTTAWGHDEPVPVTGLSGVKAIAAGDGTGLALLSDGTVMAWGANEFGQLGDGTLTDSEVPVAVSGLSEVSAIAVGGASLALRRDGTVMSWGSNGSGQLGVGTFRGPTECFTPNSLFNFCSTTPVAVSGLERTAAIAAGGGQSLARLDDGTVMAWGAGWQGQLGNESLENSDAPAAVSGLGGATAIVGGEDFSLAYGMLSQPPASIGGDRTEPPISSNDQLGTPSASSEPDVPSPSPGVRPSAAVPGATDTSKAPTPAQKLADDLAACRKKPKRRRAACARQARKRYPVVTSARKR
jgi:alpha-tubulin suppressor-like RCC1 family protein